MIKGQFFSIKTFEKSIRETNLIKEVAKVNVHITFISGKHDLLVPKLFPKNILILLNHVIRSILFLIIIPIVQFGKNMISF